MCSSLQSDETSRYALKCLLHRFRCRRHFLFQKDFASFIQNAVARPTIAEVHANRELVSFENHVSLYPNSANLFHCRSPFPCFEHVQHWERIASRWRPAFSSHLVSRAGLSLCSSLTSLPVGGYQTCALLMHRCDVPAAEFFG